MTTISGINDSSGAQAALKRHYQRSFIETMTYRDKPLFALLPKRFDNPAGDRIVQPVFFADPQSGSRSFAEAQLASTSASLEGVQFLLNPIRDFAVGTLDGLFLAKMKGDVNSFLTKTTQLIDGFLRVASTSSAINLYGNGWGRRGVVATGGISGVTVTLSSKRDITKFEKGLRLQAAAAEQTGGLRDSGQIATIATINRNAGSFTVDVMPATWAAGDSLFRAGDRQDTASPTDQMIAGLEAWLPVNAPSSTAFRGVDRTADSRLYGVSHDGTAKRIDEALIDAVLEMETNGCPSGDDIVAFINPIQYGELVHVLRSKDRYDPTAITSRNRGRLDITFRGVNLDSSLGPIKIMKDRFCPDNRCYILKMDTWKYYGLGEVPHVLTHMGVDRQWQTSADGVEIRVGSYSELGCAAPGWNANVQLTAP